MKKTGIFKTTKKDGSVYYRVSITKSGKHISLGSFTKQREASKCYDEANDILKNTSVDEHSYDKYKYIPFDKFIILLNYRDNRIYIHNPIYLKKNYFNYYLDENTVLKFDRDDLFYYSNHKICKRGNHLFCNEYGNQINIAERYSIPAYAVLNRDYRFKNGDIYDYTYSNIEILNKFHGVKRIVKGNKVFFESRIHIKGYTKIGEYEDEITASIAYNKAADLLMKKIDKTYKLNFPELNAKEYARIYTEIELPDSIAKYK